MMIWLGRLCVKSTHTEGCPTDLRMADGAIKQYQASIITHILIIYRLTQRHEVSIQLFQA